MQFPSLKSAKLIHRYKRFMADVELPNGSQLILHCANTGKMTGCADPGDTIWYSDSHSTTREYPCSWELTQLNNGDLVCINTQRANALAIEAIHNHLVPELDNYEHIVTNVKSGIENSRIDVLLTNGPQPDCYMQVKSVTLVNNHTGMFPDTETTRDQKHLRELIELHEKGYRAIVFFCGLHEGIESFEPSIQNDPVYSSLLMEAMAKGVEVYAYACKFMRDGQHPTGMQLTHTVPVINNYKNK